MKLSKPMWAALRAMADNDGAADYRPCGHDYATDDVTIAEDTMLALKRRGLVERVEYTFSHMYYLTDAGHEAIGRIENEMEGDKGNG